MQSSRPLSVVRVAASSPLCSTYLSTHSPRFSANRPSISWRMFSTSLPSNMEESTHTRTGTIDTSPLFRSCSHSSRDETQKHLPQHLGGHHRRLVRRIVGGGHFNQVGTHHLHLGTGDHMERFHQFAGGDPH